MLIVRTWDVVCTRYYLIIDLYVLAEQVFAAASGYNAGAGAAASWTLIKVLNMCMIVLGRSHGVISSRSPAGRHEPGVGASTTAAPGASTTSTRYQQNCTCLVRTMLLFFVSKASLIHLKKCPAKLEFFAETYYTVKVFSLAPPHLVLMLHLCGAHPSSPGARPASWWWRRAKPAGGGATLSAPAARWLTGGHEPRLKSRF